jgi:NDP-sugar pyrophosphorylase family protein
MKAMIFAAGLGTRLYPYTADRPKALVEVAGKTLLERAVEKVSQSGFQEIVINIHHFGQQIIDFLESKNNFGLPILISDEREQLLDTGGGIKRAADYLSDKSNPFLVYNVDVLSSLDLSDFLDYHIKKGGLATLGVRKRETSRYFLFDEKMLLSGWRNISSGDEKIVRQSVALENFAFSGIHLIQPEIFDLITETGKFSMVDLYLRLAQEHNIYGFHDTSDLWMDLGKPEQLKEAEKLLLK